MMPKTGHLHRTTFESWNLFLSFNFQIKNPFDSHLRWDATAYPCFSIWIQLLLTH